MLIKVLSVGPIISKQGPKAAYSVFELGYESDGRSATRNIMEFAKVAYAVFKNAKPGEFYNVETVKNGKYWDWAGVEKAEGQAAAATSTTSGYTSKATNAGTGYRGESPEERAQRQIYIVRQSSITAALTFLGADKEAGVITEQDVINCAKKFEKYVFSSIGIEDTKEPDLNTGEVE